MSPRDDPAQQMLVPRELRLPSHFDDAAEAAGAHLAQVQLFRRQRRRRANIARFAQQREQNRRYRVPQSARASPPEGQLSTAASDVARSDAELAGCEEAHEVGERGDERGRARDIGRRWNTHRGTRGSFLRHVGKKQRWLARRGALDAQEARQVRLLRAANRLAELLFVRLEHRVAKAAGSARGGGVGGNTIQ